MIISIIILILILIILIFYNKCNSKNTEYFNTDNSNIKYISNDVSNISINNDLYTMYVNTSVSYLKDINIPTMIDKKYSTFLSTLTNSELNNAYNAFCSKVNNNYSLYDKTRFGTNNNPPKPGNNIFINCKKSTSLTDDNNYLYNDIYMKLYLNSAHPQKLFCDNVINTNNKNYFGACDCINAFKYTQFKKKIANNIDTANIIINDYNKNVTKYVTNLSDIKMKENNILKNSLSNRLDDWQVHTVVRNAIDCGGDLCGTYGYYNNVDNIDKNYNNNIEMINVDVSKFDENDYNKYCAQYYGVGSGGHSHCKLTDNGKIIEKYIWDNIKGYNKESDYELNILESNLKLTPLSNFNKSVSNIVESKNTIVQSETNRKSPDDFKCCVNILQGDGFENIKQSCDISKMINLNDEVPTSTTNS